MTLFGTTDSITTTLQQNGSMKFLFPVVGQSIPDSALPVSIKGQSTGAADIAISFNPNGLIADYLKMRDYYVHFQKQIINDYDLTDTLRVDYIDVADGEFIYLFDNYTNYSLQVNITQLNLWKTSWCEHPLPPMPPAPPLRSIAALTADASIISKTDSQNEYLGQISPIPFPVLPGQQLNQVLKNNLSSYRLFPLWDTTADYPNGGSVARVIYTVQNPVAQGNILTISAADSMLIIIRSPQFKFKQMGGTVMKAYARKGDTAKVAVPFPLNGQNSTLRNNLIFKKVYADFSTSAGIPNGITDSLESIDTFKVTYTVFPPNNPSDSVIDSEKLLNVTAGAMYRHVTDLTSIINTYPDSICIAPTLHIPVGTHVVVDNDLQGQYNDPNYAIYMGETKLSPISTVRVNAVLSWQALDTAELDMGTGTFKTGKGIRRLNKLDSLQVILQHESFKSHQRVYEPLCIGRAAAVAGEARFNVDGQRVVIYRESFSRTSCRICRFIRLAGSTDPSAG